jgi:hypothetical protein
LPLMLDQNQSLAKLPTLLNSFSVVLTMGQNLRLD